MINILQYTVVGTWYPEACKILKLKTLSILTISEEFDGKSQPVFHE
jgi:hypothetical protein